MQEIQRLGKRIVFNFPEERYMVLHMMINGRLYWRDQGCKIPLKNGLAAFDFPNGSLLLTEVGAKKRASLHLVEGRNCLEGFNAGGLEIFDTSFEAFRERLTKKNHTLKRALTDPKILSGIGNAYSDEILHRAQLSPILLTQKLTDEQVVRLHKAVKETLLEWTQRLRTETGDRFPEKVTAFRKGMAVHGRYRKPCPNCSTAIQRIRYSSNETNYCPQCQTDGKLLADRSLSRLLRKDWPRTPEGLEQMIVNHHT